MARQAGAVQAYGGRPQHQLAAAFDTIAVPAQRRQGRIRATLAVDAQDAIAFEHRQRRRALAILADRRDLRGVRGLGESSVRQEQPHQAGGDDGEGSNPSAHRPAPLYFMVGMMKALSSTSPSGQRAVTVLTLV